jgi:hypothetical protein
MYNSATVNDYASFATITQPTSTVSGALLSFSVEGNNPNGKILTVSFPLNVRFNATSTVVANTATISLSAYTITMTKNNVSFTNFSYVSLASTVSKVYNWSSAGPYNNLQQPFAQITVYFIPDNTTFGAIEDIYEIKIVATVAKTAGGGTVVLRNGGSGFSINEGTVNNGPIAGFGFATADTPVTALAITKNQQTFTSNGILQETYLAGRYINFVYERSFTSVGSGIEYLAFGNANYNTFDISWTFTGTAPTANSVLLMGLSTNAGIPLTTAVYNGSVGILWTAYSHAVWTNTTGCLVAYTSTSTNTLYRATITYPNNTRPKRFEATNNGVSSTFTNAPTVSTGYVNTSTAYPSFFWNITAGTVTGNVVVTGRNL